MSIAMADPPMCHLLPVISCMLLHLVIASAQLEPTFTPGEAPNDHGQNLASPPSSLLAPAVAPPPAFSPSIAESPAMAPTPAVHSPTTLISPSGSADTPVPAGSIVPISTSSPPSQAAPAPAFEDTHSPPAPPASSLLLPPSPLRSPLPSSSSGSSSSSSATSSSKEGLNAAKKAWISVGVLLTVAFAGLIAFIIKRRRHNIQRSQYGRNQYRGYQGDTL